MKAYQTAVRIGIASILTTFSAIAAPEAPIPLSFDLLLKTKTKAPPPSLGQQMEHLAKPKAPKPIEEGSPAPVYAEELTKLKGKRIRITGFVAPYQDPDNMKKVLLFNAATGCFFCNPPEENGIVLVRLADKEKPLNMDNDTITVEGTLHLLEPDSKDEEAKQFFYTIDEAKVVPAGH